MRFLHWPSGVELLARSHPALVCAVIWLVLVPFSRRLGQIPSRLTRLALVTLAIVVLTAYGAITIWYASQVAYFDRAEPTITAVSSIFGSGQPLYPPLDAAPRYVHVYGPVLFIAQSAAMALLGHTIVASKLLGALAALVGMFVSFLVLQRRAGYTAAVVTTGVCGLVYLGFGNATFWTRPDPLLILCVVLGLLPRDGGVPADCHSGSRYRGRRSRRSARSRRRHISSPSFVVLHSRAGRRPCRDRGDYGGPRRACPVCPGHVSAHSLRRLPEGVGGEWCRHGNASAERGMGVVLVAASRCSDARRPFANRQQAAARDWLLPSTACRFLRPALSERNPEEGPFIYCLAFRCLPTPGPAPHGAPGRPDLSARSAWHSV